MSEAPMTLERMIAILNAYGREPRRWPLGERAVALAFLETHPTELTAAMAAADDLDRLLADAPRDDSGATLQRAEEAAIEAFAHGPGAGNVVHVAFVSRRGWVQACAALAACAVLGVMIGYANGGDAAFGDDVASIDAAFDFAVDGGAWPFGGGR